MPQLASNFGSALRDVAGFSAVRPSGAVWRIKPDSGSMNCLCLSVRVATKVQMQAQAKGGGGKRSQNTRCKEKHYGSSIDNSKVREQRTHRRRRTGPRPNRQPCHDRTCTVSQHWSCLSMSRISYLLSINRMSAEARGSITIEAFSRVLLLKLFAGQFSSIPAKTMLQRNTYSFFRVIPAPYSIQDVCAMRFSEISCN